MFGLKWDGMQAKVMNKLKLTKNQIKIMKHAISGPCRNWFGTDKDSRDGKEFEILVCAGYATKQKGPSWCGDETIYRLTEKGKEALRRK